MCVFYSYRANVNMEKKLTMNWNKVVGSKGRCKVIIDKWTNDNGDEKTSNKIAKFYEPDESKNNTAPAKKFEPGRF